MSLDGPLPYYGGKKTTAQHIIPHFPKGATLYVEPFFGGGGVFFQMPKELFHVQVINDLNKSIVTFYRVLRTRVDELIRVCELTPYALEEHRACKRFSEDNPEDELEVARRVWVRARQSFGGDQTETVSWRRVGVNHTQSDSTEVQLRHLRDYAARFRSVHIDCEDATQLVSRYAKPGAFIYEDPPYHIESRSSSGGYQYEMTEAQHLGLFDANEAATKLGAKIMISGYGGAFYDQTYKNWRRTEFTRYNMITNPKDGQVLKTEVLWMNYPASEEIGAHWQSSTPKGKSAAEKGILKALRGRGIVR